MQSARYNSIVSGFRLPGRLSLTGDCSLCARSTLSFSVLLRLVFGFLFLALFNACSGKQSALDSAGPQATRIENLWWYMFWVCSAVFIIVMAVLFYAILQGRKHLDTALANDDAHQPVITLDVSAEQRRAKVILAALALTAVILFSMLLFDFATGRALKSLTSPEPVVIQLTGHQWWWDVRYEDAIAGNTVTTANEIHIPVGQPVMLKSSSADVIHSFWVPNLHGKKDLIPGQQTTTWFQADKPGIYRGQCAEFCGLQHAKMALLVIAESPEDFNAWLAGQRLPSPTPASPEQQRGQQVFLSSTCVMCHTIRGTTASSRFGPDLTHLATRQMIAAATLPNLPQHLGNWITNSQEIKPGNRMPPVPLKDDELQALLSYLESLQ